MKSRMGKGEALNYFKNNYNQFRLPIAEPGRDGLRWPQLGALHAIASHFSLKTESAIVTMPTGSGKTAVLNGAAFLLRSSRALVITPSRMVREQITEEFRLLRVLKKVGAVNADLQAPSVHAVEGKIETEGEWQALSFHDVIVSTPNSISPGIAGIVGPPSDFFDLVLIDEAHHSAAESWKALLDNLSTAKQVHFTATPFRRDRRELPGKLIFNYELRQAYEDGVFGQLTYSPVQPAQGEDADAAIAMAAARQLRRDRERGLEHRLMVRTATKTRAHDLHALYTERTGLALNLITGDHSLKHLRGTLEKLRTGDLDGVVCVDMLGEGFDFPNLKVAALHSPHRSLAVTLQFIGRFARTNAPNLGSATFFALASDMEIERVKLYDEAAAWEDIIPDLSGRRIREEEVVREELATFTPNQLDVTEAADLSLYSLRPYHHVKVLNMGPQMNILREITFPAGIEVVHQHLSQELSCAVFVIRQQKAPEWATVDYLDSTSYDLVVNYYHRDSGLLFICSSLRSDGLYEHLAWEYTSDDAEAAPRGPSLKRLNKVLLDLDDLQFFNIGMRKSGIGNNIEAYRTVAGSSVDQAIDQSHSRAFRRGHWYASALSRGERITIGLSSGSKLWSNRNTQIPQLITWCRELALKITSDRVPQTASGLDYLSAGEDLMQIPENVVFCDWHHAIYTLPRAVRYTGQNGMPVTVQLLDLDLRIDFDHTNAEQIALVLSSDDLTYKAVLSLEAGRLINADEDNLQDVLVVRDEIMLDELLNHYPPVFYTSDFGSFQEFSYFPPAVPDPPPFRDDQFETVDWDQAGIDIEKEFGPNDENGGSVHEYLRTRLVQSDAAIVFYDHGPGEIADFISFSITDNEVRICLYHCKASSTPEPGGRIDDAYEVCGQAAKSERWANQQRIVGTIRRRLNRPNGASRFDKGNLDAVEQALDRQRRRHVVFQAAIVQPGFSRAGLGDRIPSLLAAADAYLFEGGRFDRLRVLGSA